MSRSPVNKGVGRMRQWTWGYVWKDETGEIHIEETTVPESPCGCITLHIPAGHLQGLMAGPWISEPT